MNIAIHETLTCQVLVIGAGGAGIRAALTAAEATDDVLLISETVPGDSGSTFYPLTFEWGMLSSVDEADTRQFTQEILTAAKAASIHGWRPIWPKVRKKHASALSGRGFLWFP